MEVATAQHWFALYWGLWQCCLSQVRIIASTKRSTQGPICIYLCKIGIYAKMSITCVLDPCQLVLSNGELTTYNMYNLLIIYYRDLRSLSISTIMYLQDPKYFLFPWYSMPWLVDNIHVNGPTRKKAIHKIPPSVCKVKGAYAVRR